jgi:uncharacterized membrane protein
MIFYQWLLLLHIFSAIVWMGAGITLVLLAWRAKRLGEELEMIDQMEWIGSRVGGPAVIISLGTGLWMVVGTNLWQFSQAWVVGGLIILILLFLVGVGFHLPQYKRIRAASEEYGKDSLVVQQLIRRSFAAAQIEVALLVIVIFLMVFKPGI